MRIGVDVGGTNTDAVMMDGRQVVAWTKSPTTSDVSSGIAAAVSTILGRAGTQPSAVSCVMIGTTHLANALVERKELDRVGVLRIASPSGEALPPMTGWPAGLANCIGDNLYLLPGGYEVDGREIAAFDAQRVRLAARELRARGIEAVAVTSAFAPINAAMERRAAAILGEEHPDAVISLSSAVGRIGLVERENAAILNASLGRLARRIMASFETAMHELGVDAPVYISQNDGTLISAKQAAELPVLTIGSGPTNSMRGAAFLTDLRDAIILDVGGTTTDIGVLANGFPRESSIAHDIGGVRTNFRMPDILSMGLGGGTRLHLRSGRSDGGGGAEFTVGPDSVGYRIATEALVFGGNTLTATDVAVAAGHAQLGDAGTPRLDSKFTARAWNCFGDMLAEGVDRMKTTRGDVAIVAVGGGNFLVPATLKGALEVLRPEHAAVANAIGAAIAQVGAQVERLVDYDVTPRTGALDRLRAEACRRLIAAGGDAETAEIVDLDEVFLSYMPGRTAQVRVRAVGDLLEDNRDAAAARAGQISHAN